MVYISYLLFWLDQMHNYPCGLFNNTVLSPMQLKIIWTKIFGCQKIFFSADRSSSRLINGVKPNFDSSLLRCVSKLRINFDKRPQLHFSNWTLHMAKVGISLSETNWGYYINVNISFEGGLWWKSKECSKCIFEN